jgi:AbrB family looped-hinge helix DNA binding protein
MGQRGRIVLPASVRKRLGLRHGDRLVLIAEDSGEIRLMSLRHQVERCAGMFAHLVAPGTRPSEELIAERRLEAAREEQE